MTKYLEYHVVMDNVSSILTLQLKIYKIMGKFRVKRWYEREIILKIDEDNDIYEMTVNGKVYTLDNVYESEYSQLFDELNMSIECV
jgi:glutathionyl-hydroquinone reductase